MPLADWVINKEVLSDTIALGITNEDFTPPVGTGTLHVKMRQTNSTMNMYNTTYTRGKTTGKIRSIINPLAVVSGTSKCGFYFLSNQDDITSSGTGLIATVTYGISGDIEDFIVESFSSGLDGVFSSVLSIPINVPFQSSVCEVEWQKDIPSTGFVRVILRFAIGTDFNNLLEVGSVDDNTLPLTSSSEGITALNNGASSSQVLFDNTEIFSSLTS